MREGAKGGGVEEGERRSVQEGLYGGGVRDGVCLGLGGEVGAGEWGRGGPNVDKTFRAAGRYIIYSNKTCSVRWRNGGRVAMQLFRSYIQSKSL